MRPSVISDAAPLAPAGSSAWARWKTRCGTAATSQTTSATAASRRSASQAAARASTEMAKNAAP